LRFYHNSIYPVLDNQSHQFDIMN